MSLFAIVTLLFDVRHRCWAAELLDRLGIPRDLLPKVNDSTDIIGQVSTQAAAETGLTAGTPVIAGGADQPVAALGNGVIKEGLVHSTIGTGLFNCPEGRPATGSSAIAVPPIPFRKIAIDTTNCMRSIKDCIRS
jgi:xylulokinase